MIDLLMLRARHSAPTSAPLRGSRAVRSSLQEFRSGLTGGLSKVSLKELMLTTVLMLAVLASAVGVVYASHLSRQLIAEQAVLQERNDQLQLEWVQLLLEQSAWSTPNRVEQIASERLALVMPGTGQVQLIY
jgi:cell division protein FtsL